MRTPALKPFPGTLEGIGDANCYKEAYLAYVAYFGTYTVDPKKDIVTHHVEGSLRVDYMGTDQVRPFHISTRIIQTHQQQHR